MQLTHYEILEIPTDASPAEIKQAYRRQAMKWHPDRQPEGGQLAEERFKDIARAYSKLSNATERARYDRWLRRQGRRMGGAPGNANGAGLSAVRQFVDQVFETVVELTRSRVSHLFNFFGNHYLAWYGERT